MGPIFRRRIGSVDGPRGQEGEGLAPPPEDYPPLPKVGSPATPLPDEDTPPVPKELPPPPTETPPMPPDDGPAEDTIPEQELPRAPAVPLDLASHIGAVLDENEDLPSRVSKDKQFGVNRITPVPNGWQAVCYHHKRNSKTGCKKKITTTDDASEETVKTVMRRLCWWLVCHADYPRQRDHNGYDAPEEDVPSDEILEALQITARPLRDTVKDDEELDAEELGSDGHDGGDGDGRGGGRGRGRGKQKGVKGKAKSKKGPMPKKKPKVKSKSTSSSSSSSSTTSSKSTSASTTSTSSKSSGTDWK